MEKSKIEEALGKYNLDLTTEQVAAETKALLDAHLQENMNKDVYKFLMGSIELTTLKTTDCDRSVMEFTEKVNQFDEAYTTLPVIGIPVKASELDGMDALLATVQMPSGIPVATVAINGAANAAILAAQMLAIEDAALAEKLNSARKAGADAALVADGEIAGRY